MSKVYIKDMKMPECCDDCRFFKNTGNDFICLAGRYSFLESPFKRQKFCPLVEVKDEK